MTVDVDKRCHESCSGMYSLHSRRWKTPPQISGLPSDVFRAEDPNVFTGYSAGIEQERPSSPERSMASTAKRAWPKPSGLPVTTKSFDKAGSGMETVKS